jgi:putative transposase
VERLERFFRTVNEMFLCELDGYIRRKRHEPSLSLEQFEDLFRTFLLETYHRRTSVKGRPAPSERWEEGGLQWSPSRNQTATDEPSALKHGLHGG